MVSYNLELSDWMSIILQIWDNFYKISLEVLTKKKQNTRRAYQDSQLPPSAPTSFNLTYKIFSLNKKKQMKYFQLL